MDTKEETLTIEEIDSRLAEIPARLEQLAENIQTKTDELGKSRILGLLTPPIHKSIRMLEDEQRELSAELEYLTSKRECVQREDEQKAAEDAAASWQAHHEQLTGQAIKMANAVVQLPEMALEYERIELLMEREARTAGNLVNPSQGGVRLRIGEISRHLDQLLLGIQSYNSKDNLKAAGIDIPDYYQARMQLLGSRSLAGVSVGSSHADTSEPAEPKQPATGLDAAMRQAAGLSVE
jgi:hypothetical protein